MTPTKMDKLEKLFGELRTHEDARKAAEATAREHKQAAKAMRERISLELNGAAEKTAEAAPEAVEHDNDEVEAAAEDGGEEELVLEVPEDATNEECFLALLNGNPNRVFGVHELSELLELSLQSIHTIGSKVVRKKHAFRPRRGYYQAVPRS